MTIRTRLMFLALLVGVSIVTVTLLFSTAVSSLVKIDSEKRGLTELSEAVYNLSVVVNSLDSAQYRNVNKKLQDALARSDAAFDSLGKLTTLPVLNDELKKAFEIISNMRALMTDDLKSLNEQYAALQPDLEQYLLESNSTTIRMFYTNDRVRAKYDLKEVFGRIDQLITSINGLTETLAGVSDTIHAEGDVINAETSKVRDQSLGFALAVSALILLATVLLSLFTGASVSRRVREMQRHLKLVSEGDFSLTLPVRGKDEISSIATTVNALLDSLNRLLGQVQAQVEALKSLGSDLGERMGETTSAVVAIESNLVNSRWQLNEQNNSVNEAVQSATSLSDATEHLSGAFSSQLQVLGNSSSAIEQIIANIRSVNTNAEQAEASTRILAEVSRDGQTKLNQVAKAVHEIARSSENLVQVTALINDIADKTNLLAMNASIEAAHAGTAGRGFGVVANEIRTLAEQAALQAREISQDLEVVNENIHSIDAATGLAVDVFRKIVSQTDVVSSVVQQVQAAMDEQSRGGTQVLEGLQQLNEFNSRVGDAVAQLKRGEAQILDKIQTLAIQNALVNDNNEAVSAKTGEISSIVEKTSSLSESTRIQIQNLEAETGQFVTRTELASEENSA